MTTFRNHLITLTALAGVGLAPLSLQLVGQPASATPATASASTSTEAPTAPRAATGCSRTLGTYPILEPGDRGKAVRTLQCLLGDLGYDVGPIDGYYGPQTRRAVSRIESGFEGDGASQPGRINNGFWVLLHGRQLATTLEPGDRGRQVRILQRALRAAGGDVVVDGSYGAQTRDVVKAYQRRHQVEVSGRVDRQTLFFLGQGGVLRQLD